MKKKKRYKKGEFFKLNPTTWNLFLRSKNLVIFFLIANVSLWVVVVLQRRIFIWLFASSIIIERLLKNLSDCCYKKRKKLDLLHSLIVTEIPSARARPWQFRCSTHSTTTRRLLLLFGWAIRRWSSNRSDHLEKN